MGMDRLRIGTDVVRPLPAVERTERTGEVAHRSDFRQQLTEANVGHLNERIDKALAEVDLLGTRLGESLNMEDLKRYRVAIAGLFKDLTSNTVQVKTQMEWDAQNWQNRTLVTVRKVNEELEKLTNLVLSQEQDRLKILDRIGEITGLLIDVRM
jgi:uncharacterized protein YaaR (DUF327 family)